MHLCSFVNVVQNADDSKHRCGVYPFAQGFVVEADVATSDGNLEFLAGLCKAVDGLRELPHDRRLLGISEIQAIGCADRIRPGAGDLASGLSDRMHRPEPRIEIAPASIAIEGHRQATLRALDANDSGIAGPWRLDGIGLHHVVVLLPHPALAANIRTAEKLLESGGEIAGPAKADVFRLFARNWRLPPRKRALVDGRIVGQCLVGDFGYYFAVFEHAQFVIRCDLADFDRVEAPLFEDAEDFVLAAFLRDQQHAFLRFAEHDLVRSHARFSLGNAIELDFNAYPAAPTHLAGRAGKSGGAHVLDADDRAGLHGFKTGLEEKLFQKRIAHLDIRPFRFRGFAEFLTRHGGAVNTVTPGLGPDVNHWIALAGGTGIENFVLSHQPQCEGIDQRIAGIAWFKLGLAA